MYISPKRKKQKSVFGSTANIVNENDTKRFSCFGFLFFFSRSRKQPKFPHFLSNQAEQHKIPYHKIDNNRDRNPNPDRTADKILQHLQRPNKAHIQTSKNKIKNQNLKRIKKKLSTSGEGFYHASSSTLEVPKDLLDCTRVVWWTSVHASSAISTKRRDLRSRL